MKGSKRNVNVANHTQIVTTRIRRMTGSYVFTRICLLASRVNTPPPSFLMGGTPHRDWMGIHSPVSTGWGYPPPNRPIEAGWGYPLPPSGDLETEQLCCRRYASCVHAGGLSCLLLFLAQAKCRGVFCRVTVCQVYCWNISLQTCCPWFLVKVRNGNEYFWVILRRKDTNFDQDKIGLSQAETAWPCAKIITKDKKVLLGETAYRAV